MKKFLTLLTIALSLVIINHSCKPDSQKCVDLGLPSGLKWATCNVGANSPEEYGSYLNFNKACDTTYDGLRMPTVDELEELRKQCSWTWTKQNGVNGYKVAGPNGNSIFLPAAGSWLKSQLSARLGIVGYRQGGYWSSSPSDTVREGDFYFECAYQLYFDSISHDIKSVSDFLDAYSVRLVAE